MSQLVLTPGGTVSVFGFKTPIPYPFGAERTGYLVTNIDQAVKAGRAAGDDVLVEPFDDPVGRDAIIQWPGGINTQIYWHTISPSYKLLTTIPENRVYVSANRAQTFIGSHLAVSHGEVVSDVQHAAGIEIGRPKETYRRMRIQSPFGKVTVLVADGHLPYPYGREMTGYEVDAISTTLSKARSVGVEVLAGPYVTDERTAVLVKFPGGYIAELHSPVGKRGMVH
jgi:hypothetical protein